VFSTVHGLVTASVGLGPQWISLCDDLGLFHSSPHFTPVLNGVITISHRVVIHKTRVRTKQVNMYKAFRMLPSAHSSLNDGVVSLAS
jgi:hypothetical protein